MSEKWESRRGQKPSHRRLTSTGILQATYSFPGNIPETCPAHEVSAGRQGPALSCVGCSMTDPDLGKVLELLVWWPFKNKNSTEQQDLLSLGWHELFLERRKPPELIPFASVLSGSSFSLRGAPWTPWCRNKHSPCIYLASTQDNGKVFPMLPKKLLAYHHHLSVTKDTSLKWKWDERQISSV